MLADVQQAYGLARPFQGAGNFETEHQSMLVREVCAAVQTGRLVVVSGLVGSGKTHLLRRIEDELTRAGKVTVAKSLAVDKRRTSLTSLIEAMFYDLSPGDLSCPLLSGPSTITVWTKEGTTNACEEAQARGDYREAT